MPKIITSISKGLMERGIIEKVRIAVFIVDGLEVALTFPDTKDEVGITTLFVSKDSVFYEWCSDYFDYMWKDSKPFEMNKVKVVEY